jgi:hypothetical protein
MASPRGGIQVSREKKICAIYSLSHKPSGRLYIGKSVDICHRQRDHIVMLQRGTHHCEALQKLWNESSPSDFRWYILKRCSRSELDTKKSEWIDRCPPEKVINGQPAKATSREKMISPASLAKIVVEKELLGRPMRKDEKLHFLDGDRENISSSNLVVLPRIGCDKLLFHCPDCGVESLVKKAPASGHCKKCTSKRIRVMGTFECIQCGRPATVEMVTQVYGKAERIRVYWCRKELGFSADCEEARRFDSPFCPNCRKLLGAEYRAEYGDKPSKNWLDWDNWQQLLADFEKRLHERKKRWEDLRREIKQIRSDMMHRGWERLEALSARLLAGDRPHPIDFMNAACMANGGSLGGVSRDANTEAEEGEGRAGVGEVI